MYAVIKTGGKQYRVQAGDMLIVEKLVGEPGAKVAFDQETVRAPVIGDLAADLPGELGDHDHRLLRRGRCASPAPGRGGLVRSRGGLSR